RRTVNVNGVVPLFPSPRDISVIVRPGSGGGTTPTPILATKASVWSFNPPALAVWKAPPVVGNPNESVDPVMYALPAASRAMPRPISVNSPPKKVEYTSAVPDGFSLVTNASLYQKPKPWMGLTAGKFGESVSPVT